MLVATIRLPLSLNDLISIVNVHSTPHIILMCGVCVVEDFSIDEPFAMILVPACIFQHTHFVQCSQICSGTRAEKCHEGILNRC